MRESWVGRSLLIALLFVGGAGCRDAPSVSAVRWQLERQLPGAEFDREFGIRLGRLTLAMVRGIASWGLPEDDEDLEVLRHVRRVEVGTYRVVSLPPLESVRLPDRLVDALDGSDWSLMVRTADEDERIWLFVREDGKGVIRNLYVVALDEVELTMVSLEGRLDRLLAEAIADDPSGFAATLGS